MKGSKILLFIFYYLLTNTTVNGQDPVFSQFFSSPLNVNPALTANINGDWRVITNYRNQWMGAQSPFVTGTVSADTKLFQNKNTFTEQDNFLGLGGMMMFDRALEGFAKSTFAAVN